MQIIDALLALIILSTVVLALTVDVAVLIGWLDRGDDAAARLAFLR